VCVRARVCGDKAGNDIGVAYGVHLKQALQLPKGIMHIIQVYGVTICLKIYKRIV
jgi:hypothetical protein